MNVDTEQGYTSIHSVRNGALGARVTRDPSAILSVHYSGLVMDIQRWLDETAEAETPQKPVETTATNFFYPTEQPKPVFVAKRKRPRTKSDSSILALQPTPRKAPLKAPGLPVEDGTDASACSEESRSSHSYSTESDSSSHYYARKPRRKTRPDRYEPKRSKESRKHVHPSRRDKSKKSKARSKNKRRKHADSAAGQTFHAKNVSQDRLTVRVALHVVTK